MPCVLLSHDPPPHCGDFSKTTQLVNDKWNLNSIGLLPELLLFLCPMMLWVCLLSFPLDTDLLGPICAML